MKQGYGKWQWYEEHCVCVCFIVLSSLSFFHYFSSKQALIYPITVASKTSSRPRQEAAGAVMADMRKYNPVLVEEASLVSREMIKVYITG